MSVGCVRVRAWVLVSVAVSSLVGCGGGDDEPSGTPVTCAWLETEENCWGALLREADTCFGELDIGTTGTFNAARDVCSYDDGRQIRFSDPVPLDPDDYEWNYDVLDASGATCLELRNDERSMSISGASGRAVQSAVGQLDLLTTCPDGTRFRMPFEESFSCFTALPGTASSWSGDFVSVTVSGGGSDAGRYVSCSSSQ